MKETDDKAVWGSGKRGYASNELALSKETRKKKRAGGLTKREKHIWGGKPVTHRVRSNQEISAI